MKEPKVFTRYDEKTGELLPIAGRNFKVSPAGVVTPLDYQAVRNSKPPKRVKSEGYWYSKKVLRTIKRYEFSIHAMADFSGLNLYMFTLTFPLAYENDLRDEIAKDFFERCRKKFPSGMWNTEIHLSGRSFGLYHYHIKILSPDPWKTVLRWRTKTTNKYCLPTTALHLSKNYNRITTQCNHADIPYMFKLVQKSFVKPSQIWGQWKIDAEPAVFSYEDVCDLGVHVKEVPGTEFKVFVCDDVREAAYQIQVKNNLSNFSESFED